MFKKVFFLASLSTTAFSSDNAIDALWSLDNENINMQLSGEYSTFEDGAGVGSFKLPIGDWIKYHSGTKFKWRSVNKLDPVDGYNFLITKTGCTLEYLTPVGSPAGSETRGVGYNPGVRFGQTAVWEAKEKKCVNRLNCSVEIVIEGLEDVPDARRTMGPYFLSGSRTEPNYDCFVEAALEFVFD
ncbi:hypothetical protein [Pseudobacteriovorax antillogorgiicola]|uniref:Uncharacterized protein n=1 Tax=Pseudobacteriovorax antillogorgiicola TaxID=1513793 RepID=A0A1Y6CPC9_9BACT|nr:hypothetical protein [Pseudobacteriovorax antillogorgiicola]TCS47367.1 hypothetical protein EDD56_121142 [Pseudobacteriovorax antillogorgiicola]SMF63481.1 hypothetical protein SAMN06296036_121142 [Pseudobacteriovorax antillogorgiicola]